MATTNMYRTRTIFTGIPGSPFLQTLFWDAGSGTMQQTVDALEDAYDSMDANISADLEWRVDSVVDVVDPVSGSIVNQSGVNTTPGVGISGGDNLPRGTQGLVHLRTGVFQGGRQVSGKFYLPGPTETESTSEGVPSNAYLSTVEDVVTNLTVSLTTAKLVCYSRKNGEWFNIISPARSQDWARLDSRRR